MKISKRLVTIANMVHKGAHVVDVGADHGLLEKYLLDNNIAQSVLAVENKPGPFEILSNNLQGYDVKLSLSDGLDELTPDVDTIVIAGMGGNLIVNILTKDVSKLTGIKQIIVDAHKDAELVRRTINGLGYRIEKENIVVENNIYYFIISFVKGEESYKDIEYEFGYKTNSNPLFQEFKAKEVKRLKRNIALKGDASTINEFDIEKSKKRLERLESLWIQLNY